MEIRTLTRMMNLPEILVAVTVAVDVRAGMVGEAPLQAAETLGTAIPRRTPRVFRITRRTTAMTKPAGDASAMAGRVAWHHSSPGQKKRKTPNSHLSSPLQRSFRDGEIPSVMKSPPFLGGTIRPFRGF